MSAKSDSNLSPHEYANLHNMATSSYKASSLHRVRADIQKFPNYAALFNEAEALGPVDHDSSIFSAAAYFLDLMRLIDAKKTTSAGSTGKIPPALKNRRPDLLEVELDARNTTTEVPYLEIANNVMIKNLQAGKAEDPLRQLATSKDTFNLPYNAPLEQIRIYLKHLGTNLATIYELTHVSSGAIARETLGLSPEEFDLTSKSTDDAYDLLLVSRGPKEALPSEGKNLIAIWKTDMGYYHFRVFDANGERILNANDIQLPAKANEIADLKKLLAHEWASRSKNPIENEVGDQDRKERIIQLVKRLVAPHPSDLANNLKDLLTKTGLTLPQLKKLVYPEEPVNAARPFNKEISGVAALSNKFPNLKNSLVWGALHRFVHLAIKLQWSFEDLNWALTSVKATKLDENTIIALAQMKKLQERLNLAIEELTSFWHVMKWTPQDDKTASNALFNRTFNDPHRFFQIDDSGNLSKNADPQALAMNWQVEDRETAPNVAIRAHLSGALGVGDKDLDAMVDRLLSHDNKAEKNVNLSLDFITRLYRISKLASVFGLDVSTTLLLLDLLGKPEIKSSDDLHELTKFVDWLKDAHLTSGQLQYLTTGKISRSVDPGYVMKNLGPLLVELSQAAADWTVKDRDFIHGQINGTAAAYLYTIAVQKSFLSEQGIIVDKPTAEDITRSIAEADLSQIEDDKDRDELRATLLGADQSFLCSIFEVRRQAQVSGMVEKLSGFFEIDPPRMRELTSLTRKTKRGFFYDLELMLTPVKEDQDPSSRTQEFLAALGRFTFLAKTFDLTAVELNRLADIIGRPISNDFTFTIKDIMNIDQFKKITRALHDTENELLDLISPDDANGQNDGQRQRSSASLAKSAGPKNEALDQLRQSDIFKGAKPVPMPQIAAQMRLYNLANTMGVDTAFLKQISNLNSALLNSPDTTKNEQTWQAYQNAARDLLNVVMAKVEPSQWTAVSDPLIAQLNEQKRDALTAYLINHWKKPENSTIIEAFGAIDCLQDLSNYLLMDVQMSGVAKISKVKQGLNTLQRYIQRCHMGLEGDVRIPVGDKEWSWRANYRLWEANRKVFLYPENYLEPGLRRLKTPLYEAFEEELLQGEISEENVTSAYLHVFDKLDELANLQIVDSLIATVTHPQAADGEETLFLIAKSSNDPPQYYYRTAVLDPDHSTIEQWQPWQKISLSLQVDNVVSLYVDHRLYICWIEQKLITERQTDGIKTTSVKAAIKYSYQNVSGDWFPPQTLPGALDFSPAVHKEYLFPPGIAEVKLTIKSKTALGSAAKGLSDNLDWIWSAPDNKTLFAGKWSSEAFGLESNVQSVYRSTDNGQTWKSDEFKPAFDLEIPFRPTHMYSSPREMAGKWEEYFFATYPNPKDPTVPVYSRFLSLRDGTKVCITKNVFMSGKVAESIKNKYYSFHSLAIWDDGTLFAGTHRSGVIRSKDGGEIWESVGRFPDAGNVWIDQLLIATERDELYVHASSGIYVFNLDGDDTPAGEWSKVCDADHLFGLSREENSLFFSLDNKLRRAPLEYLLTIPGRQDSAASKLNEAAQKRQDLDSQYLRALRQTLVTCGVSDLLSTSSQSLISDTFNPSNPYTLYYRELFFHIPFLIADRLNGNQKFENAQKWYHTIFNPLAHANSSGEADEIYPASRFWQYLPFKGHTGSALNKLADSANNYKQELKIYSDDPFDPHAIAELRLGAYEKAIVMKYIDNLLDWGDQLFTQDDWEDIVQAMTLYVMAQNLLGKKPDQAKPPYAPAKTKKYIDFSQDIDLTAPFHVGDTEYFQVPANANFFGYWDLAQDRLFKIRHSMNIKGIVRQLALFQPPIDPRMLMRALAAGLDPANISDFMGPSIPHYRFRTMIVQAKNVTATLIELGAALLRALERKDVEQLELLHNTHEKALLKLTSKIREKQIEEAQKNLDSLQDNLDGATERMTHFENLYENELTGHENAVTKRLQNSIIEHFLSMGLNMLAIPLHLLPVIVGFSDGGMQPGTSVQAEAAAANDAAAILQTRSQMSGTQAQFDRRKEEWRLQKTVAEYEVKQIEKQIAAAGIRQEIAQIDLDVNQKRLDHEDEIEDFLRRRFTNNELYECMIRRISTAYFQSYKIAFDLAQAAEKAFQYERDTDESFITFGYWDNMKKGLLAGEGLMLGLQQLEKAYMDAGERHLEIEKTISLLQLDPTQLIQLKEKGNCTFELNERLFDQDFPGHYCRKIKTIAITIPAVVGPNQNIQATLKQTKNSVLLKNDLKGVQHLLDPDNGSADHIYIDPRQQQQIAISKGIEDSGIFELNFRDERYLPFEGTGALSNWELRLPKGANRSLDFNSISDVIIKMRYTARDGGDLFRKDVTNEPDIQKFEGIRLISLKQEFSSDWQQFLSQAPLLEEQKIEWATLPFSIKKDRLTLGHQNFSIVDPITIHILWKEKPDSWHFEFDSAEKSYVVASDNEPDVPNPADIYGDWKVKNDDKSSLTALSDIVFVIPFTSVLTW